MAVIQFIQGINEDIIPDVRLTRSRDGSTGTATFRFSNPKVLESSTSQKGTITGMYLIDEEGVKYNGILSINFQMLDVNQTGQVLPENTANR